MTARLPRLLTGSALFLGVAFFVMHHVTNTIQKRTPPHMDLPEVLFNLVGAVANRACFDRVSRQLVLQILVAARIEAPAVVVDFTLRVGQK